MLDGFGAHALNCISDFFLEFSNIQFVFVFLITGFCFLSRKIFYQATLATLLCMLTNVFLKVTFKVPLAAFLNKSWFAFPSGHMMMSTACYGWLAFSYSSKAARFLLILLLCGIALGLNHYSYHTWLETFAGIGFGLVVLTLFAMIDRKYPTFSIWIYCLWGTCAIIGSYLQYPYIPVHALMSYWILLILVAIHSLFIFFKKN